MIFFCVAAEGLRLRVNYYKGIFSPSGSSERTSVHLCQPQGEHQQQRTR